MANEVLPGEGSRPMSELPPFPKWKPPKGKRRLPHTDEESRPLLLAREAWAATRVVGWEQRGLQTEDYDFRSWATRPGAAERGEAA